MMNNLKLNAKYRMYGTKGSYILTEINKKNVVFKNEISNKKEVFTKTSVNTYLYEGLITMI